MGRVSCPIGQIFHNWREYESERSACSGCVQRVLSHLEMAMHGLNVAVVSDWVMQEWVNQCVVG